jgi:hypothetical protein
MRPSTSPDNGRRLTRTTGRKSRWLAIALAVASPAWADEGTTRRATDVRGGAEAQTTTATRPAAAVAVEPEPAAAARPADAVVPAGAPALPSASPPAARVVPSSPEPAFADAPARTADAAPASSDRSQPLAEQAQPSRTIYQEFLVDLYASLPPTPPLAPPSPHYAPAPPPTGFGGPVYVYDDDHGRATASRLRPNDAPHPPWRGSRALELKERLLLALSP